MSGVVLVTGGGRGIGAAVAVAAAAAGWDVAIGYRGDEGSAEGVADAARRLGVGALTVRADVADEEQVLRMFAAIDERWGRLDGLVNNAGIVDQAARVDELTPARIRRLFDVNVLGSFLCAREAVRRMSTRHGGRGGAIVNVSSAASRLGSGGQYVDYAATKGAIDTFTVGLAREVATEGIRVNAVRPGLVDTDIHASGGQPDRARQLAPEVPMKRVGAPREIAEAVVWFLSPAASYATGAILDVSGGR